MSELDQIIKILIRKSAAVVKKSAEDLNELLDSKFVYLDSRGNRANKRQYIEHCCKIGKMKLINQRFGHIDIQDFNSFAIATMIVHEKFNYQGEVIHARFKSMYVFRKTDNGWIWSAGQTMPVRQTV